MMIIKKGSSDFTVYLNITLLHWAIEYHHLLFRWCEKHKNSACIAKF